MSSHNRLGLAMMILGVWLNIFIVFGSPNIFGFLMTALMIFIGVLFLVFEIPDK